MLTYQTIDLVKQYIIKHENITFLEDILNISVSIDTVNKLCSECIDKNIYTFVSSSNIDINDVIIYINKYILHNLSQTNSPHQVDDTPSDTEQPHALQIPPAPITRSSTQPLYISHLNNSFLDLKNGVNEFVIRNCKVNTLIYNILDGYNRFKIAGREITLTQGHYDIITLVKSINKILDRQGVYTILIDNISNKCIVKLKNEINSNISKPFTLDFAKNDILKNILGFNNSLYSDSTIYYAENIANIRYYNYFSYDVSLDNSIVYSSDSYNDDNNIRINYDPSNKPVIKFYNQYDKEINYEIKVSIFTQTFSQNRP